MVSAEAKLAVQSFSGAYSFFKDVWLYLKDKARYVKNLEDNLTYLIVDMETILSRMTKIERDLGKDVSKEESREYDIVKTEIDVFRMKYKKFIDKYNKHRGNLPSAGLEPGALIENKVNDPNNVSSPRLVIDNLQAREPTILTLSFFELAKLSREIEKLHERIRPLLASIKQENMSLEKEPEYVQVKDVDIDIPSFSEYVKGVLRYLNEDEIRSIGIGGLIGVGKTTVLKMFNNQFKDTRSCFVIWIDYPMGQDTQDKIVEAMQDAIIRRLKLTLGADTKADIISTFLCDKEYILLIDQVSSYIDLNKVGIRKDHKKGKVVVASSSKKIIKQMTDDHIEMQTLSEKDAFILFEEVCGKIDDTRIKHIAEQIIESCGGLPLVIKMVAKHLKGEIDEDIWEDVRDKLQSEPELLELSGVGNAYKVVYDGLEKSYKKCFLFGALFPSGHNIYKDYLVECWVAERFLPFPQLRKARVRGATVLRELTDQYLLERCSHKHVKMPVYFRKVALQQQYPDEENSEIWAPVPETKKVPDAGNWRTIKRMSLIGTFKRMSSSNCKFELPKSPECQNMTTLLLQWNPELVDIEDSFFVKMQKLRVLNLNQTGIRSLPSSISGLGSLLSLYLNDCSQLSVLPTKAEELKMLEFLDIRGTSMPSLPNVIGCMICLKCLRVSLGQNKCKRNSKGKEVANMIPPDIITKLKQLEELTIETGCCNPSWNNVADQTLEEVANLVELTTLSFHFPSVRSLEKFVTKRKSWKNTEMHCDNNSLRSFKFSIGCCETKHPYGSDITGIIGAERQLRFSTNEKEISSVEEVSTNEKEISSVKEVLRQASAFELVGHSHVKSLSEFDLKNAGTLKVCIVESCKYLQSIVKTQRIDERKGEIAGETTDALLQCLEKLHLFDLQSLQSIWDGSVFSGSLSNLKVLTLYRCPHLMAILNPELAEALSSLEHLKVEGCSKIADIVKVKSSDKKAHPRLSKSLHKLETIELVKLPELVNICSSDLMNWKSLRKIVVRSCSKLRKLYFTLENAEKLKIIQCEYTWWAQLDWRSKPEFTSCLVIIEPEWAFITGASSSNRRSVNPSQASDIINSESKLKEAMPSNGGSTDLPTSNIDAQKRRTAEERQRRGKNIIIQ